MPARSAVNSSTYNVYAYSPPSIIENNYYFRYNTECTPATTSFQSRSVSYGRGYLRFERRLVTFALRGPLGMSVQYGGVVGSGAALAAEDKAEGRRKGGCCSSAVMRLVGASVCILFAVASCELVRRALAGRPSACPIKYPDTPRCRSLPPLPSTIPGVAMAEMLQKLNDNYKKVCACCGCGV